MAPSAAEEENGTHNATVGRRPTSALTGEDAFTGAWLAVKLGIEPRELDARRRAGELLGVPREGGGDYVYPTWQLGPDGRPLAALGRVIQAARAAGLGDGDLYELLLRRDGLTGSGRLVDALREGREERVLDVIRSDARRESRAS